MDGVLLWCCYYVFKWRITANDYGVIYKIQQFGYEKQKYVRVSQGK